MILSKSSKISFFSAVLLCIVLLCNTTSQLMMKAAALFGVAHDSGLLSFVNIWYFMALCSYALSFLFWQWVLRRLPLSLAHPFSALVFFLVPFGSWYFFNEVLSWTYIAGVVCICVGVSLVAKGAVLVKPYSDERLVA